MTDRTEFILGTVQLGMPYGIQNIEKANSFSTAHSREILKEAEHLGIRLLETSNNYGEAQRIIGQYSNKRFEVLSKFTLNPESPQQVREQLHHTLNELKMSSLYCYSYHRWSDLKNHPDSLDDLLYCKNEGLIENIGVSVYSKDELNEAIRFSSIDIIQTPFNVVDNLHRRGALIREARAAGKQVHARSVFLQGLLLMDPPALPVALKPIGPFLEKLNVLAERSGLSRDMICLLYVLQKRIFSGVVIGIDNAEQLKRNWETFTKAQEIAVDLSEADHWHVSDEWLLDPTQWPQFVK